MNESFFVGYFFRFQRIHASAPDEWPAKERNDCCLSWCEHMNTMTHSLWLRVASGNINIFLAQVKESSIADVNQKHSAFTMPVDICCQKSKQIF